MMIQPNPFVFRNGQNVYSAGELIRLCEQFPTDAAYHLLNGHFEPWLRDIGRNDLAREADKARGNRGNDQAKLSQFIENCKEIIRMALKIKSPYRGTPYEQLPDPQTGLPLSSDASVKEVQARYTDLAQQRRPPPPETLEGLRRPSRRIAWDIFCTSLSGEQQALQELINEDPTFHQINVGTEGLFTREILFWGEALPPLLVNDREMALSLPPLNDQLQTFKAWLSQVDFDV